MNLFVVLLLLFTVRLASVFIVQTNYVPDEYWQSLEVAHRLAFGYGYLTWEWVQGIRSYIYPLVIAGVYKLLALLQLDSVQLLIILPRILQSILSAYSDYRFFVWTGKRKWALFLIAISYFWFYIGSRTLANTLETSLTTIALSYFPWHGEGSAYLWYAALCCFLRPTAAIIWIPLALYHLSKSQKPAVQLILRRFLPIGVLVAAACVGIDSYFYGKLIVTPYEFLKYNIVQNIGAFYGSHPWHWYFTAGLPTVLGINFLPFLWGVVQTIRDRDTYETRKTLLYTILASLVVLSVVEHKEFRFVASLLPLCLYISADTLTRWSYKASTGVLWVVAIALLIGNAGPAWYLSTVHQKGPLLAMNELQQISRDYVSENNQRASILFLMPCHSTPYYSHIHENVTMRFLTCEPNFDKKPQYKDEADQFYDAPAHWLRAHIPAHPRTAMPSHVVLFDSLKSEIRDFLSNYKQLSSNVHAEYFAPRTGKHILIYQRLRAGEENTFNREEWAEAEEQVVTPTPVRRRNVADDIIEENEFHGHTTEQNLFN